MKYLYLLIVGMIFLVGCSEEVDVRIPMHLQVSDYNGVNVDTDAMYFGSVNFERPGMVQREVTFTNTHDGSESYFVDIRGDLKLGSSINPKEFVLDSGESVLVVVKIKTEKYSKGNYTGELVVYRK